MSNPRFKFTDGTRCNHDHIGLEIRPNTTKTNLGQTRFWLRCTECGFENGPFTSSEKAISWELARGRADGPSLMRRFEQYFRDQGLPLPWEDDATK